MEKIENNFESLCSYKIETNSKGHNTTLHLYQGCTKDIWQKVIDEAVDAHNYGQSKLNGGSSKTE
jgi:hypothetical protein